MINIQQIWRCKILLLVQCFICTSLAHSVFFKVEFYWKYTNPRLSSCYALAQLLEMRGAAEEEEVEDMFRQVLEGEEVGFLKIHLMQGSR